MPLLSKASNVVQNVSFLYDVTGFTQIGRSIPVATNCSAWSPTAGGKSAVISGVTKRYDVNTQRALGD